MRINTNVASLQAQQANKDTQYNVGSSLEKLSTGLRINKAADDGSGLAIADKLRTQASSIKQSIANANSAVALTQIADKAMAEQSNILDTVKTKLLQASTSTTSAEGRASIQNDITKLLNQLDNIAAQTNYNGTTLLDGSSFTFQVGESSTSQIALNVTEAADTSNLGTAARGTATVGAAGDAAVVTFGVDSAARGQTLASFDSVNGSNVEVGDTFRLKVENLTDGTTEIFSYTVTQSDIDTSAAGGISVASAIGTGFAAQDARLTKADGGMVSFTAAAGSAGDIFKFTVDSGATISGVQSNVATNGLTVALAKEFTDVVDGALNDLNVIRSEFGSSQNQLESSIRNMQVTHTNLKAAESVIRDVDYATESANFNKQNIIAQAGTYAMSQANAVSQNVLRLLQ